MGCARPKGECTLTVTQRERNCNPPLVNSSVLYRESRAEQRESAQRGPPEPSSGSTLANISDAV